MKSKATGCDWTAWTLHLIFGLVVGGAMGIVAALRLLKTHLIEDADMVLVALGAALVVGAASSHWGDRLWMRPSVFSMDEPPRSKSSWIASSAIGGVGIMTVLLAILHHPSSSSVRLVKESAQSRYWAFPVLVIVAAWLIWSWQSGTLITPMWIIHRDEHPALFWFFLCLYAIPLLGLAWLAVL